jgi:EAL domain-containing protein (putative c-di-GMP-specific phosphodiesterase class I)
VPVDDLDVPINKVRGLFREDPLVQVDESGFEEDRLATWYDLASKGDLANFKAVAEQMLADANERKKAAATKPAGAPDTAKGTPLTSQNLGDINRKIQAVRIADFIRQQTAIQIGTGGKGQILFRENFVAMAELKEKVAPGVNLFSSIWLFQFLTETLDKRVLAVMAQRDFAASNVAISLNLNVGTVLSRDFQQFHQVAGSHAKKVVVEMQMVDIFADMNTFAFARDSLQQRGYRVLVDGLNPLSLQFFDPSELKSDFVKIAWGPEFSGETPESRVKEMREVVAHTGKDAVILARVDSEDAIKWGLSLGITRFQGRFIDRLVNAMAAQGRK